jgi:multidrug efflux pump subunit AcrB
VRWSVADCASLRCRRSAHARIGTGALVIQELPTGFLPNEDQGVLFLDASLPSGSALPRTSEVLSQVREICAETPGVATC